MSSYWANVTRQGLSRRRALAAGGGAAAAAAILAACGEGGSDGGDGVKDTSGLLSPVVDETKSLKRGGTFKYFHAFDQQTFDPMFTSLPNQSPTNMVYSQFWFYTGGHLKAGTGEIEGDIADAWEFSPDRLQLTLKLTDKARFAPVAPVNGRAPDAQDAIFSWERFKTLATRRFDLANEVNAEAPIVSMTAPDAKTVVIKLAAPFAILLHSLTNTQAGNYFIVPRESENQNALDLRRTQLGSGPWYLENYTPSVGYTYKKNPGFKQDKRDLPYMDQVELPIVSEYSAQLAQFRAGAMHHHAAVRSEDLLSTKREVSALEMISTDIGSRGTRNFFGMLQDSPFRDERVRQAWTMSIDRDLFIDVQYNIPEFTKEGLPMETAWDSALACTAWEGWWVSPKNTDWGKFYHHNVAEAKKLLAAAGHPSGLDVNVRYPATGYPNTYFKDIEVFLGMVPDAGFRPKIHLVNFNNEWRPQLADARGKFEGTSFIVDSGGQEPANNLYLHYNVKGSLNHGYDAASPQEPRGDSTLNDLTTKARIEFDEKKRKDLVLEIQKYEARKLFFPRAAGGANSFQLYWPAFRGQQVWRNSGSRVWATNWLDPTKAPLRQS